MSKTVPSIPRRSGAIVSAVLGLVLLAAPGQTAAVGVLHDNGMR